MLRLYYLRMLRSFIPVILVSLCVVSAEAQSHRRDYSRAEAELAPFRGTQVLVDADFVETVTPQRLTRDFGNYWVGCPKNALTAPRDSIKLMFATAATGRWVNYDGIQVELTKMDGTLGSSLMSPSDSTVHIPGEVVAPKLSAWFDFDLLNARRNLIDAAAEEFDRCYSELRRGSYTVDELAELCPLRRITRSQQGQTCLVSTYMYMRGYLDRERSVPVILYETTSCDFVGSPQNADTATSFSSCFTQVYSGQAYFGGVPRAEVNQVRRLLPARQRAIRRCSSMPGDMAAVQRCVYREMARARGRRVS